MFAGLCPLGTSDIESGSQVRIGGPGRHADKITYLNGDQGKERSGEAAQQALTVGPCRNDLSAGAEHRERQHRENIEVKARKDAGAASEEGQHALRTP